MADYKPVKIISDNPVKNNAAFGFDAYAKTIAEVIANKENATPLVIGIYGSWGTGKTTLMENVRSLLEGDAYSDKRLFRKCKTVWFHAWKYNNEDEILAALIEQIFKTMATENFFEAAKAEIEKITKSLDKSKLFGEIIKKLTTIDISEFFSELEYKERLGFYDTFQKFFDDLVWTYLNWRAKLKTSEKPDDRNGVFVVFIDDLDRCPGERIVKVLETIKLFMDRHGCVFVIGAAIDIIEKALKENYGDEAGNFMDKIVHVTFNLPRISEKQFETYFKSSDPVLLKDIISHLPVLLPALKNNPRQLKHFQNNISLMQGIIRNTGIEIDPSSVLHCGIFEYAYPRFWRALKENPVIITMLKEKIQPIEKDLDTPGRWEIPDELFKDVPKSLQEYVKDRDLIKVIRHFSGTEEDIRRLTIYGGIVEGRVESPKPDETRREAGDLDDMVKIPAGEFLYGKEKRKENIEKEFWIDVYPMTNSGYRDFILADGYKNEEFWSNKGWEWRKENDIRESRYWTDEKWNQPDYPVVGITWYEADAFCKWLTILRKDGFTYRLPTGKEWERAARGKDGNVYPWGDEFENARCNSKESGINQTSRVTRFPNGISPEGCYDMAGNVWEWMNISYDNQKALYMLRGGAWNFLGYDCRCDFPVMSQSVSRDSSVGFRCARTVTL